MEGKSRPIMPVAYQGAKQGRRKTMEDSHITVDSLTMHPEFAFYAVFDGHNGDACARFCETRLVQNIDRCLGPPGAFVEPGKAASAIVEAFTKTDEELLAYCEQASEESGCTAVCALVNKNTHQVIVGNAGDARAILAKSDGKVEVLTVDHKPSIPEEKQRIEAAGHVVHDNRLDFMLAVSRALGDLMFKVKDSNLKPQHKALSPYPYVKEIQLHFPSDEHVVSPDNKSQASLQTTPVSKATGLVATPTQAGSGSKPSSSPAATPSNASTNAANSTSPSATVATPTLHHSDSHGHSPSTLLSAPGDRKDKEISPADKAKRPSSAELVAASLGSPKMASARRKRRRPVEDLHVDPSRSYQFLVIACDGLYDVMSNQEVIDWINEQLRARARAMREVMRNHFAEAGLPHERFFPMVPGEERFIRNPKLDFGGAGMDIFHEPTDEERLKWENDDGKTAETERARKPHMKLTAGVYTGHSAPQTRPTGLSVSEVFGNNAPGSGTAQPNPNASNAASPPSTSTASNPSATATQSSTSMSKASATGSATTTATQANTTKEAQSQNSSTAGGNSTPVPKLALDSLTKGPGSPQDPPGRVSPGTLAQLAKAISTDNRGSGSGTWHLGKSRRVSAQRLQRERAQQKSRTWGEDQFKSLDKIAEELCLHAIKKGSQDNVSVVIVMLEQPPRPTSKSVIRRTVKRARRIIENEKLRSPQHGEQSNLRIDPHALVENLLEYSSGSDDDYSESETPLMSARDREADSARESISSVASDTPTPVAELPPLHPFKGIAQQYTRQLDADIRRASVGENKHAASPSTDSNSSTASAGSGTTTNSGNASSLAISVDTESPAALPAGSKLSWTESDIVNGTKSIRRRRKKTPEMPEFDFGDGEKTERQDKDKEKTGAGTPVKSQPSDPTNFDVVANLLASTESTQKGDKVAAKKGRKDADPDFDFGDGDKGDKVKKLLPKQGSGASATATSPQQSQPPQQPGKTGTPTQLVPHPLPKQPSNAGSASQASQPQSTQPALQKAASSIVPSSSTAKGQATATTPPTSGAALSPNAAQAPAKQGHGQHGKQSGLGSGSRKKKNKAFSVDEFDFGDFDDGKSSGSNSLDVTPVGSPSAAAEQQPKTNFAAVNAGLSRVASSVGPNANSPNNNSAGPKAESPNTPGTGSAKSTPSQSASTLASTNGVQGQGQGQGQSQGHHSPEPETVNFHHEDDNNAPAPAPASAPSTADKGSGPGSQQAQTKESKVPAKSSAATPASNSVSPKNKASPKGGSKSPGRSRAPQPKSASKGNASGNAASGNNSGKSPKNGPTGSAQQTNNAKGSSVSPKSVTPAAAGASSASAAKTAPKKAANPKQKAVEVPEFDFGEEPPANNGPSPRRKTPRRTSQVA